VPALRIGRWVPLAATMLVPAVAFAQPHAGDTYEIIRTSDSTDRSAHSSGTAHDKDTLVERVLAVREDGIELEYDLPAGITAQERAGSWQFPVRVFKPLGRPLVLRNRAELESRVDAWLKSGGLKRTACGRWYFTWNAFRVECDPASVLDTVTAFDLRPDDLRDGGFYKDKIARAAAPLRRMPAGSTSGTVFTAEMAVDPDIVLRERAEADVVVAEIGGKALALDSALRARAAERVSGTVRVTFYADAAGNVHRRKKVTKLETNRPDGQTESRTVVETLERRPAARRDPSLI
jgi:hypothetical protein